MIVNIPDELLNLNYLLIITPVLSIFNKGLLR